MIIEIGSGIAYSLFSQADWKTNEYVIKKSDETQSANSREYFIDLEKGLLYMETYNNSVFVERVEFKSTKLKMKHYLKYEMQRQKEKELYSYE